MADFLVLRLASSTGDSVDWIAVDDRGARCGAPGRGTLEDAARAAGERSVILLVPGEDVLTLSASVPARGAKLAAALPYALEDQLADDIDTLHFAAGSRGDDGTVRAAVVARDKLDAWLDTVRAAGINPSRVVPDYHGLANVPNTLSMLVSEDRLFFNDGAGTQFAISGLRPGEALAAAGLIGEENTAAARHLLVYCEPALADVYEKDWALLRHELDSVDVQLLPDGALPRLAVTVATGTGINLLQGAYGARTEMKSLFAPWRYAAMFLAALLLVTIGVKGADIYQLNAAEQRLQQQFTEEYRRVRPQDTREIVDPLGTVRSLRQSVGTVAEGPQVFLPSLQELASALQANSSAKVEAISYRAGVIDVRLNAPDIPTLDRIVQAVGASGRFEAELQSADSVGERVNSRIQIREAGA